MRDSIPTPDLPMSPLLVSEQPPLLEPSLRVESTLLDPSIRQGNRQDRHRQREVRREQRRQTREEKERRRRERQRWREQSSRTERQSENNGDHSSTASDIELTSLPEDVEEWPVLDQDELEQLTHEEEESAAAEPANGAPNGLQEEVGQRAAAEKAEQEQLQQELMESEHQLPPGPPLSQGEGHGEEPTAADLDDSLDELLSSDAQ